MTAAFTLPALTFTREAASSLAFERGVKFVPAAKPLLEAEARERMLAGKTLATAVARGDANDLEGKVNSEAWSGGCTEVAPNYCQAHAVS